MVVNISTDTYDVYVTPEGQAELTIATGFSFRTVASQLNNRAIKMAGIATGVIDVCNFNVTFPTPTPTQGPWYKLKDGSFSKLDSFINPIPASVNKFDTDDPGNPYLVDSDSNEPGVIVVPADPPSGQPSIKDWIAGDYNAGTPFTPATFLSYVRSRKEYHTVTNFNSLESGNIYLYQGSLTLNDSRETSLTNAAPLVLIVTGEDVTVTIDDATDPIFGNSASPDSIAIVTDGSLNIGPSMKELNGLFVAKQVNFGSSNQELKIVGNIISTIEAEPSRRSRADKSKPSIFIVFKPEMYLNLLPYFSTAAYEWRLLQ